MIQILRPQFDCKSFHPFPATPWQPRRPQPSAQFSPPICRPQPSAQPSSLITSGFFSPPISRHSFAPRPSAAVRAVLRTHFPSAAVRAAKLAHHRLLLPTHFQPLRCTHAVRSRPRNSPNPFPVRSRPRSRGRWSPAASSPHPFPATPWHPRRPQPSAQPSSLITSGFFSPTISSHRCTHAVRSRPRSQTRWSPAVSFPTFSFPFLSLPRPSKS